MATSGSQNFTQTRNEVILDAYQLLGVYGSGMTVSSDDMAFASSILNKMVKGWVTKGLHLWERSEAILFLTPYIGSYTIGNGTSDANCSLASDTVITRVNGALSASATSVIVDSTTGMVATDKIGIVLADKTIFWTTISSVDSSTTLTLTSGVTGSVSDNALVYTYTNKIYKPARILSMRRVTGLDTNSSSSDYTQTPLSEVPYNTLINNPSIASSSTPLMYAYTPNLTSGNLLIAYRSTDGSERLHFTYERIIEDLDSTSDNFDFPSEWLETLTYQLAVRLALPFGKSSMLTALMPLATGMLENLLSWDNEISSVSFIPDGGY